MWGLGEAKIKEPLPEQVQLQQAQAGCWGEVRYGSPTGSKESDGGRGVEGRGCVCVCVCVCVCTRVEVAVTWWLCRVLWSMKILH
jgi:hypothetical protein